MKNLFLLLVVVVVSGCGVKSMPSSDLLMGHKNLSDYPYAVVYQAKKASFLELEIDQLLTANRFTVIGKKEAKKYDNVIGVRYLEVKKKYDGRHYSSDVTLVFEDMKTDKVLFSIKSSYKRRAFYDGRKRMFKKMGEKLKERLMEESPSPEEVHVEKLEV